MEKIFQYSKNIYYFKVVMFGLIVGVTMQLAYAWVAPTAPPPNGNIGLRQYVSDCNQFAANGWSSKNECLTDGRWHMAHSHGSGGAFPSADLRAAYQNGADIKVVATFGSLRQSFACSVVTNDAAGHLLCLDAARYGGNTDDASLRSSSVAVKGFGASVVKTSGVLTCVSINSLSNFNRTTALDAGGCGPSINVSAQWFVKY